jgi:hypothetical protein
VYEAEVVAGWSFESSAAVELWLAFSVEVEYRDCWRSRAVVLALEIAWEVFIALDFSCP